MARYSFVVNGKTRSVNADPDTPLLYVLRENLGLTGPKFGCGLAQCGACLVHVDGEAVPSCVLPVSSLQGRKITTLEGLGSTSKPHPVQQAFIEEQDNTHGVRSCNHTSRSLRFTARLTVA